MNKLDRIIFNRFADNFELSYDGAMNERIPCKFGFLQTTDETFDMIDRIQDML